MKYIISTILLTLSTTNIALASINEVPEPGALSLLALGIGAVAIARFLKK